MSDEAKPTIRLISFGVPTESRRVSTGSDIEAAIQRNDIAALLRLAEGYWCGCMGARDGEPDCFCVMNKRQVRETVSYAALKEGRIVRLKGSQWTIQ